MAKNTVKYRKPQKQKKYFTKKDIPIAIIVVLIIAAVVVFFAVKLNNDNFIRSVDGVLQMEDNWIIANYSSTNTPRYYKIGEIGEIEGYEFAEEYKNSNVDCLVPTDETNTDISNIMIGTTRADYLSTTDKALKDMGASLNMDLGTAKDITIAGRPAKWFSYNKAEVAEANPTDEASEETVTGETDEAEESNPMYACCYIKHDDENCVYIQIAANNDVEVEPLLAKVGDAITWEEKK